MDREEEILFLLRDIRADQQRANAQTKRVRIVIFVLVLVLWAYIVWHHLTFH